MRVAGGRRFHQTSKRLTHWCEAIERAGFRPGEQVGIALDIAASEFGIKGRYKLALDDKELDYRGHGRDAGRMDRPLSDPVGGGSVCGGRHGWICCVDPSIGQRIQIVGDDFLVSDADRLQDAAAAGAANTILLKPNQRGTLTETLDSRRAAKDCGYRTIVSARSGETEDVTIAHLAVGWNAGQLKVGSFSRGERMAKWNEMLRIEEALGGKARFAGGVENAC